MNTKVKNIVVTCVMAVFIFGFAFWAWLKPADTYSETERKHLKPFPEITWDSIVKKSFMKDFETYTLEQFPLRDTFAKIKGGFNLFVMQMQNNLRGDNNYYIEDGYVSEMEYPMNPDSLQHVATRLENIYNLCLANKNTNLYFSIIPDKNYFMAENAGQLVLDYEALVNTMKDKTSYMEYIDIFGELSLEDYYKTDTHWRQEMIVDVAQKLGSEMGVTLAGQYKENTLDNLFAGVYYGQSGIPGLKKEPLVYLTSEILEGCTVMTYDKYGQKIEMDIYDMEKAEGNDLYETFLSGSLGYIEITNPNATTDKELVIFRDSFGSSLSPLLVEGYAKVTILDTRYFNSSNLAPKLQPKRDENGQMVFENGKPVLVDTNPYVVFDDQDVLFIYSTLVLNNGMTLT